MIKLMRFFVPFFTLLGFLCLNNIALAEEVLKLYLGETRRLSMSNPTRVVLGNPSVVDISKATKKELTLTPKTRGSTTMVIWDDYGEQSYLIKVFSEDVDIIKKRVDKLLSKLSLPDVYTQPEEDEEKVFLMGSVKTAQDRERINVVLGELRSKIVDLIKVKEEEAAVEIDVQILELNKDATKTLGFTFPGSVDITETGATLNPALMAARGTNWSSLFRVVDLYRGTGGTVVPFAFKIDALIQEGKAKVLSRPRLACQSGKEAELIVGGEKPIFTTAVAVTGGEGTEVEYKEFGIKLKIKPTVTEEERIKLALNIEVSEVGEAETIGAANAPTAKAYPLSKRNASTELYLEDGQAMAIGGLMKEKTGEDLRKVPFLGDVPVIGALFRKKETKEGGGTGERGDTELFILLTPKIIKQAKSATKILSEKVVSVVEPKEPLTPEEKYASLIQKRIIERIAYPASAKKAGFQGTVKLNLHLSFRGELLDAKVDQTSGYRMLDDNALRAAKEISSYPPLPPSIQKDELWVIVPVSYQLD